MGHLSRVFNLERRSAAKYCYCALAVLGISQFQLT